MASVNEIDEKISGLRNNYGVYSKDLKEMFNKYGDKLKNREPIMEDGVDKTRQIKAQIMAIKEDMDICKVKIGALQAEKKAMALGGMFKKGYSKVKEFLFGPTAAEVESRIQDQVAKAPEVAQEQTVDAPVAETVPNKDTRDKQKEMCESRVEWEQNSANIARGFMIKHKQKFMEAGLMEKTGLTYSFGKSKDDNGNELSVGDEFAQIDKDAEDLKGPNFDEKEREELIDAVLETQRGDVESSVYSDEEKKDFINEFSFDENVNPNARKVLAGMSDMELISILRKAEVVGRKSEAKNMVNFINEQEMGNTKQSLGSDISPNAMAADPQGMINEVQEAARTFVETEKDPKKRINFFANARAGIDKVKNFIEKSVERVYGMTGADQAKQATMQSEGIEKGAE